MKEELRKEKKRLFIEYFSQLPVQKLGAEFINVHVDTITDWKKADPEFSEQVGRAKTEWALRVSKQVRSKEWLLERVMKDHFAERKELVGSDGNSILVEIVDPKKEKHGTDQTGD